MSSPRFGYCLPIFANPTARLFRTPNLDTVDGPETIRLGVHAESLGYDSLWVADHLMLGRDEAILEGWTTLSMLAGATHFARLGIIHQSHYFRSPAITAKMTATLDHLTGGRFILFYDYGQQLRENRAYHLPYPDGVDQRVAETVDGVRLIRDLWAAETPISASHGPYAVTNASATPRPSQRPHPPIWFGETHPGLLATCAELGQGWNTTPCTVSEFTRRAGLVRAACAAIGREPGEIELSVEIQVLIAPDGDVRSTLGRLLDKAPDPAGVDPAARAYASGETAGIPSSLADITLIGSPDEVRAQVQAFVDAGASHFLLWFLDAPERDGMDLFAREVIPAFR
jgi:alkanesulfonate monooxygenase SsuD/methylene tetrahydromethanopterin reductase-like flavin-dependent oxidoreductase (luciferase family)